MRTKAREAAYTIRLIYLSIVYRRKLGAHAAGYC